MKRYRTYKILKWIFAVLGVSAVIAGMFPEATSSDNFIMLQTTNYYISSAAQGILAIFFKLQEDSNKPTVKE